MAIPILYFLLGGLLGVIEGSSYRIKRAPAGKTPSAHFVIFAWMAAPLLLALGKIVPWWTTLFPCGQAA